jgi:hypothetical protein
MSEIFRIFLTAGLTVLGGTFVFIAGQIAVKFFIEPIHEQRRLVGEISHSLIYYANVDMTETEVLTPEMQEASNTYRRQAGELMARTHGIPAYGFLRKCGIVPRLEDVIEAHEGLLGVSNSVLSGNVSNFYKFRDEVIDHLNLGIK